MCNLLVWNWQAPLRRCRAASSFRSDPSCLHGTATSLPPSYLPFLEIVVSTLRALSSLLPVAMPQPYRNLGGNNCDRNIDEQPGLYLLRALNVADFKCVGQ